MRQIIVEESGDINSAGKSGMSVIALATDDPPLLRQIMKIARDRFSHLRGIEFKARREPLAIVASVLRLVAQAKCQIYARRVGDLRQFHRDRKAAYADAVAGTLREAWADFPGACVILHKRYEQADRDHLTRQIVELARSLGFQFSAEDVRHLTAKEETGIEVADAIAYAITQRRRKHKRKQALMEIIRDKIHGAEDKQKK